MKLEINVDTAKLYALAHLCAKADVRYYLCGVNVEATRTQTRLAATNGHIMGLHARAIPPDFDNKGVAFETVIVPRDLIERCKPVKGQPTIATILIERTPQIDPDEEGNVVYNSTYQMRMWDGALFPFEPCVGKFPAIRRVIPQGAPKLAKGVTYGGVGAQFNPEYLALFVKVAKLLGDRDARIQMLFNGANASIRIACADNGFIGVLMPQVPSDSIDFDQPRWPDEGPDMVPEVAGFVS